jgi:hypothetical protein
LAIAQTGIFSLGTTAHEYLRIGGRRDGLLATVSGYAKVLASGHEALIVWGSLGLALAVVFGRWVIARSPGARRVGTRAFLSAAAPDVP